MSDTERNQQIYQLRTEGDTFGAIGRRYSLSAGRVREIYLKQERIRKAEAVDPSAPVLSVRAFNVVCTLAASAGWGTWRDHGERIGQYIEKFREAIKDGRLSMRRHLLHWDNRPIKNCGKKCSAEIWAAISGPSDGCPHPTLEPQLVCERCGHREALPDDANIRYLLGQALLYVSSEKLQNQIEEALKR